MELQDTRPLAIEARGICKAFPGVVANDQVDLQVRHGEVHVLLGENGAGKTTLMNVLAGLYQPDSGEVWVDGRLLRFGSPLDSIRAGIGVIHQHFHLVEVFSVAENLALGQRQGGLRLDMGPLEEEIERLTSPYGWKVDPHACIWQLCMGDRQRVEILKALYHGANVLILDEPTAVLTPQEARQLADTLRQLASAGQAIIYISHKLKEVLEIADRITILRSGRNVGTFGRGELSHRELARLMVGRDVPTVEQDGSSSAGPIALEIKNLQVAGDVISDCELPAVRDFSLTVLAGQILGLAGVSGNGQRELAEAIAGLRHVRAGRVLVWGKDVTNRPPIEIIEAGVSLIPEDRLGTGLVPMMSVEANAILKSYRHEPISRGLFLDHGQIRRSAERLVGEFSVQVTRLDDPVWKLSGGNLQRLLLAREMLSQPKVLVAVHPTRGLDVQATADVHRLLLRLRGEGAAILLISEDLDEILALADWVAVIHEGQMTGCVTRSEADIDEIGLLMVGAHVAEVVA